MENLHGIKRVKGSNQKAKKPILINNLKSIIDVIDQHIGNSALGVVDSIISENSKYKRILDFRKKPKSSL